MSLPLFSLIFSLVNLSLRFSTINLSFICLPVSAIYVYCLLQNKWTNARSRTETHWKRISYLRYYSVCLFVYQNLTWYINCIYFMKDVSLGNSFSACKGRFGGFVGVDWLFIHLCMSARDFLKNRQGLISTQIGNVDVQITWFSKLWQPSKCSND